MYTRICNLPKNKSFFLFGARATGKTTLLKSFVQQFNNHIWIDLLEPEIEKDLSLYPSHLKERIDAKNNVPELN